MLTLSARGVLRKSDLRQTNDRLILNIIRQNQDVSRSDIVKLTGLSASSVTFIVKRLIAEGMVAVERKDGTTQAGRPPIALRLRPESLFAVGAEVSPLGTRVAAADVNGTILAEKPVAWHANPAIALARVRSTIAAVIQKFSNRRLVGVGVGIPGTVTRGTGHVIAAENLGWFDVEAGRLLADGLPVKPILENDAKLAALAERWFHQRDSHPPRNFVFVAAARGLGTGIFIDGHLMQGASGEGSEFGHIVLYPDGRPCLCGGRGCWEEYASGRALERLYTERTASSHPVSAEEIVRRAHTGEAAAIATLHDVAPHVGLGFVNLRQAFDPEEIIVGHYLADAWDIIGDKVWKILQDRIPARYIANLRILPARHTRQSTLFGAIALVLSNFFGTDETPQRLQRPRRQASGVVA